ncbi:hypothetical protein Pcinc_007121 [Petrolisthes cinctipes]|uniref:Ionotropic glutamate receptor L-glutamate and glycine-binding domain-containing protein n=1 Tax=Petrolisthes cinctipes TaxID=88211 RepID=A0AAE1KMW6_PETCI|nr:hypothetical protein Pcinc_015657 [Petrolisthes cinctipes]KAK3888855.1 hypothetical protein Pcinc_007121 [Petrolisthes cinctipes]
MDYSDGSRDMSDAQGYNADLIRILQSALNFTSIIVPAHGFGSITSNGSWTGMVGALARREADVAPMDFSPSLLRATVVDFGNPYGTDLMVILSKAPSRVIPPFLILSIFTPMVTNSF